MLEGDFAVGEEEGLVVGVRGVGIREAFGVFEDGGALEHAFVVPVVVGGVVSGAQLEGQLSLVVEEAGCLVAC